MALSLSYKCQWRQFCRILSSRAVLPMLPLPIYLPTSKQNESVNATRWVDITPLHCAHTSHTETVPRITQSKWASIVVPASLALVVLLPLLPTYLRCTASRITPTYKRDSLGVPIQPRGITPHPKEMILESLSRLVQCKWSLKNDCIFHSLFKFRKFSFVQCTW